MAILTFSQAAPLSGFWSWMQQRNLQTFCNPVGADQFAVLLKRMTPGTRAQAGDTVRMSAFLASGTAVINYGGQWIDDAGEYRRYNRTLTVSSATSPQRITIPASEGWYRDAAVSLETAGITGQTLYVTQELGRPNGGGYAPFAMLAQGWLTSAAPVTDIKPPLPDTGGGGGAGCVCPSTMAIVSIDGIQAAQGWQVNRTPAAGSIERVVALVAYGSMGVAVAFRYLFAEIVYVGVGPVAWTETPHTLVANTDYALLAYTDRGTGIDASPDFYRELPGSLWLSEEYQLQIGIGNFQVGDTLTDGYAIIEVRTE